MSVTEDENVGNCGNCGFSKTSPYCPNCGQPTAKRLRFFEIFLNGWLHTTSLDGAFFKTLIGLSLRPGSTIRAYIQGARNRYINPAKYAFMTVTLFVLIVNLFGIDIYPAEFGKGTPTERAIFNTILAWSSYLTFLNAALLAVAHRLFFPGPDNITERACMLLYVLGHYTWLHLIAACTGLFSIPHGLNGVQAVMALYFGWSLLSFAGRVTWKTVLGTVLLIVVWIILQFTTGIVAYLIFKYG